MKLTLVLLIWLGVAVVGGILVGKMLANANPPDANGNDTEHKP